MRLFVTGASSFIGYHFARVLGDAGYEVLAALAELAESDDQEVRVRITHIGDRSDQAHG